MGTDATSISPQAVGFDFANLVLFAPISSVTATAVMYSGGSLLCVVRVVRVVLPCKGPDKEHGVQEGMHM